MKKNLLTASAAILFALGTAAQECNYYFLQNNKTVEMTIYNRKGDPNGKQIYTVSDVKNGGGGSATSSLHSEMFNKKGKSIAKGTGKVECKNGVMFVDMKMKLPEAQQEQFANADVKGDNMYIEYPADMKPGDQLKDANMNLDINNNGMKQSVVMVINDRKVEAKEPVTTTAGTWDCYKISFKSKITIKTMGVGIPVNLEGTEWFAPGFGVVKTESKHGGTAVTSIK